jgi:hypothetical protein
MFEEPKSAFNTQKVRLKKKSLFGKKIKSAIKCLKSLKLAKTHFAQKLFLTKKLYFSNTVQNRL